VCGIINFDYREIIGLVEKILVLILVLEMFPVFTLIGTENVVLVHPSTVQKYCDKCSQATELYQINFIFQPTRTLMLEHLVPLKNTDKGKVHKRL
jgi:hypothetical protein